MENGLKDACAHVFATVDIEGHGCLTYDQMMLALRILNFNPIESEIQKMLAGNKLKEFNYENFASVVTQLCQSSLEEKKKDIREAFALFDVSDSGYITKEEFVEILTQCGEMKLDEHEATVWVNSLDIHKDGLLRIAELEELFVNDEDVISILNGQKWDLV
ncbi:hypothetical protein ACF0H5_015628 [Mactra antiquata]